MTAITKFLRQQREARSPQRQAERRKEWLAAVNDLFRQIRSWLVEAQKEGLVKIRLTRLRLKEEGLGTYSAPCLTLVFGTKMVKVKPIGSVIIGADGRVDMESANGTYMFLYLADRNMWAHGFGARPAAFPELSENVFTDLLKRSLA